MGGVIVIKVADVMPEVLGMSQRLIHLRWEIHLSEIGTLRANLDNYVLDY